MSSVIDYITNIVSNLASIRTAYIIHAFDVDSTIAASLLARVLISQGIEINLAPPMETIPNNVREPIVLIGLNPTKNLKAKRAFAITFSKEQKIQVMGNIVIIPSSESSLSILIAQALEELYIVPTECKLLALAAALERSEGSIFNKRFTKLEQRMIEKLATDEIISKVRTLKLFKYPLSTLNEAMYVTIDPFIPGITGNDEGISELLRNLGIGVKVTNSDIDKLAQEFASRISKSLRKLGVSKEEFITEKIMINKSNVIKDIYETYYSLSYGIDRYGPKTIIPVALSRIVLASLIASYREKFREVVDYINVVIEGLVDIERHNIQGEAITVLSYADVEEPPPAAILARVLRSISFIKKEKIAINWKGRYCISVQQIVNMYPLQFENIELRKGLVLSPALASLVKLMR
ncbi:MAG: hypothetical protein DRO15_01185 [Thermoprotei archaeon]|nr:MAG: hypothetical protein DRO15_01185 [Thermoprotei archaeon]